MRLPTFFALAFCSVVAVHADSADTLSRLFQSAVFGETETIRRQAAEGLSATGTEGFARLLKALTDRDPIVRHNATLAMGAICLKGPCPVTAVIDALQTDDLVLREDLVDVLWSTGKKATPDLLQALQHQNPHVRAGSTDALAAIYQDEERAEVAPIAARLIVLLQDASAEVRLTAVWAMDTLGVKDAAAPGLVKHLVDEKVAVRSAAAAALASPGPARDAALMEASQGSDNIALRKRAAAMLRPHVTTGLFDVGSLRLIGSEHPPGAGAIELTQEGIDAVRLALKDSDVVARRMAVGALGLMGEAREEVPSLIQLLKDPDAQVRWRADYVLGRVGPRASEAVSSLAMALEDQDEYVREVAILALQNLGPVAGEAVPRVIRALQSRGKFIRWTAAETLGAIASPTEEVRAALIQALQGDDTAYPAASSLATLDGSAGVSILLKHLEDPNPRVRRAVAAALLDKHLQSEVVCAALLRALNDSDSDVRHAAATALASTNAAEQAATVLRASLHDRRPAVRRRAAELLAVIGPPQAALPDLLDALRDRDRTVRAAAAGALAQVKEPEPDVVDGLRRALKDPARALSANEGETVGWA